MRVGHGGELISLERRTRSHDVTRKSLSLAVALVASLNCALPCADALSLPGRRLFRRHATSTLHTDMDQELYQATATDPDDDVEEFDLSGQSPASTTSLFPSPTCRKGRSSRQRMITEYRRTLLRRREGIFQLHYKDYDDDMLGIIESQERPIRPRIFRGWKRKSLSKALFPLVEEENINELDLASVDQSEFMEDSFEECEESVELPTTMAKPIGIGMMARKKKSQVTTIQELHDAILDRGLELRDVELNYSPPPSLLTSKRQETASDSDDVDADVLQLDDEIRSVLMMDEVDPDLTEFRVGMGANGEALEDDGQLTAEEWPLIGNVLAEDSPFLTADDSEVSASEEAAKMFSHDVLNILHQRYHSQSTPMARAANDTATLALSIEGGGMRGAVSGGMAAAITCLGLSDAFDSIYGSSAGSIIGSYFVSRQLYLDVYTDVIPAGKDLFVSKSKMIGDIFRNMFYVMKGPLGQRLNANLIERFRNPAAAGMDATLLSAEPLPPSRVGGLNTSFVLDSIMCPDRGLRPLDLEAFAHNDAVQPLRIVSSAVELGTGKLKYVCFGSKEGHFRDQFTNPAANKDLSAESSSLYPEVESAEADENGLRRGLWACLGASMTVPGAAGSPFRMDLPGDAEGHTPHLCFDAFCYDPVPIRSAVAEGATHVVALRSRPAGYEPKTKPTVYERAVAPLYFRSNGVPNTVSQFFEKGGQQYLYAEDVLMCDRGLNSTEPIPIPPARVLYAAPEISQISTSDKDRENWAHAHLLPITVPADVPELSVLSQDRDDIVASMRTGFAAAYDALAPVVGLQAGPDSMDGMKVAELVFPDPDAPHESVLEKQLPLAGEKVGARVTAATNEDIISASTQKEETAANADLSSAPRRHARFRRLLSLKRAFRFKRHADDSANIGKSTVSMPNEVSDPPAKDAEALFSFLPGVQLGSLPLVAERLQTYLESQSYM